MQIEVAAIVAGTEEPDLARVSCMASIATEKGPGSSR